MADESTIEHLVQQHGISRPEVFAQSANDRNTETEFRGDSNGPTHPAQARSMDYGESDERS